MRIFLQLLAACAASLFLYLGVFGFLVSRPLVVDQAQNMLDKKVSYGRAISHSKLVIAANSNARFSHSCAVLEQTLHRPCVNLGVAGDIAMDRTLDAARTILKRGDLVYLPIEYDIYSRPRLQMLTGMDAAYRFRHDKASLAERGPEGVVRAAFMFSLPTLVHSIGEMGLSVGGVQRRFGLNTLNPQGDEVGHDGAAAVPYRAMIRMQPILLPGSGSYDMPGSGGAVIGEFLDWCHRAGIVAVGGLPTMFNDIRITDAQVARFKDFYAHHGADFLVLANKSQYPRSAFYDSNYHLRESWQKRHSVLLAAALAPYLRSPAGP